MAISVTLTSVLVDDPAKAHAFYTDVLGFESKTFKPEDQIAIVVSTEDPNGPALLLEPRGTGWGLDYQRKGYELGLPVLFLGTDDLDSEVQRLEELGVVFREDLARPEWGIDHVFEDGCGNYLMLEKKTLQGDSEAQ